MSVKRVIPCLDIKDGRVVKGVNFVDLRDAGDPAEYASSYEKAGADELVFLDINATHEGRPTVIDLVRKVSERISIPLAVGGGVRTADDFAALLEAGAGKVSVNSAAVKNPSLVLEAAKRFGSRCVVLAIDAKRSGDTGRYEVYLNGGRAAAGIDAAEWAREGERLGAGEILLTSMDADGTKNGFDIGLLRAVSESVGIPVVASGGAGKLEHFYSAVAEGGADAVLAASLFHFNELTVMQVKEYLKAKGIQVSI